MNKYGSGYYLEDPDFWSDKVNLNTGELVGLGLLQSLMKVYKNTPVEKDLSSLFGKIKNYLPDGARYDESKIAQYIRVINDPMAVIDTSIFTSLIESVQEHRAISFNYMKNGALEPKNTPSSHTGFFFTRTETGMFTAALQTRLLNSEPFPFPE